MPVAALVSAAVACSSGGDAEAPITPGTGGSGGAAASLNEEDGAQAGKIAMMNSDRTPAYNWSLFPFYGAGSSGTAGAGGGSLSGSGGTAGISLPPVDPNCDLLCDCIIDVCGNVLRIFEHPHCRPLCADLDDAQIECRFAECLQGGSDAAAALHCDHAIGMGAELPGACQ